MSLIKCPECNNDISDKATSCPKCGFPLEKIHENNKVCIYNGTPIDFSDLFPTNNFRNISMIIGKEFIKKGIKSEDCALFFKTVKEINGIPPIYNSDNRQQYLQVSDSPQFSNTNIPKCTSCQSTNIKKISTASKLGSVALWGVFSVGKISKTYHCNNCGTEW